MGGAMAPCMQINGIPPLRFSSLKQDFYDVLFTGIVLQFDASLHETSPLLF